MNMKKYILLSFIVLSVFIFTACFDESLSSSNQSEAISSENVLEEINKDEHFVISRAKEIINNSDILEYSENIEIPFTQDKKTQLLEILKLEEKQVIEADNGFGVYGTWIYSSSNSGEDLLLVKLSEEEYVIIVDDSHRIILDKETYGTAKQYLLDETDKSIKNETSLFNQNVYELIKEMVVNDIENYYSITVEDTIALSSEEIEKVKTALNISSWKAIEGIHPGFNEYKKDSVTFANKTLIGDYEYYTSLYIAQYGDKYFADCNFFEGPGSSACFEIPKEVYDNIKIVYYE